MSLREYFRLGRLFNAEILALILVLSYSLTATLHNVEIDPLIISTLFLSGVLMHVWGCYNNDRLDLPIDKKAGYCGHKPLVSGSISVYRARVIETFVFLAFFLTVSVLSAKFSTILYLSCSVALAYLYNRFNKSSMFFNIVGQFYAMFAVLVGMSLVVGFDFVVFLTALVLGLNGTYLNIIEADAKDIEGDIVNVPKALGVRVKNGKWVNTWKFGILEHGLKAAMYLLLLAVLVLESANIITFVLFTVIMVVNMKMRAVLVSELSVDRERLKPYIAAQEFSSVLLISTVYMVVWPWVVVVVPLFVVCWLCCWNRCLWNTWLRPQV